MGKAINIVRAKYKLTGVNIDLSKRTFSILIIII